MASLCAVSQSNKKIANRIRQHWLPFNLHKKYRSMPLCNRSPTNSTSEHRGSLREDSKIENRFDTSETVANTLSPAHTHRSGGTGDRGISAWRPLYFAVLVAPRMAPFNWQDGRRHQARNGMPRCFNSALPSSLVLAVVTIVMSIP